MKITLTFPDGKSAYIESGDWQSADTELATALNAHNAQAGSHSEQPHPFLHVAKEYELHAGATLTITGQDYGKPGDIH